MEGTGRGSNGGGSERTRGMERRGAGIGAAGSDTGDSDVLKDVIN